MLPFNGSLALTSQGLGSEISVAITCTGAPTLTSIAFGVGAKTPLGTVRWMSKAGASNPAYLLGYKLYAKTSAGAGDMEASLLALVNNWGGAGGSRTMRRVQPLPWAVFLRPRSMSVVTSITRAWAIEPDTARL